VPLFFTQLILVKALLISACAPDATTESQTGTTNWVLRLTQLLSRLHEVTLITIPPIREPWLLTCHCELREFSPRPIQNKLLRIALSLLRGIYPSMWLQYCPSISTYLKGISPGEFDVCWVLEDYGGVYIRDIPQHLPVAFHRSYVLGMQSSFVPPDATFVDKLKGGYHESTAKAFDRWTSKRANLVLTGTQASTDFIRENYPHNQVEYFPVKPCHRPEATTIEKITVPQGPEDRLVAVFLADMGFIRNAEGAGWFLKEVLPLMPESLRRKYHFRFIGRKPEPMPDVAGLPCGSSVEFSGFVDNLTVSLHEAQVAFIPVFGGNGIRIKTVTLLGTGLPTVSTQDALEGLSLQDQEDVAVVVTPNDFIHAFERLLVPSTRVQFHKNSLRAMDNFLNEANDAEDLLQLSKSIVGDR